ncbi:TPA: hypothetical protein ACP31O_006172 [Pseudomonas aeruginosa]
MESLNLTALFLDGEDGQRLAEVNGLPRLGALLSSAQLRQLARQLNEIANDADQGASGEHCYTAPPYRPPQINESAPGGPTVDNENETLVALLVITLIVFGIFRIVGDFQNLYEQTEQKGQELSRWSKQ